MPQPPAGAEASFAQHPTSAAAWHRRLSHEKLTFVDGDATATQAWNYAPYCPAACVRVPPQWAQHGFVLAVEIEALPHKAGWLSFGVGREQGKASSLFGHADGTCGLYQHAEHEPTRFAASEGYDFARRADRGDKQLDPVLRAGTRLEMHLSGDAGGRTARFFSDGLECALFTFDGDGEGRAWVAGVTLSKDARVRIVHAGMAETAETQGV